MPTNSNCSADIRKLGSVRNFIQVPNQRGCGKDTIYYGKNSQMMEVDAVQQDYRAQSQPIRTWNRYTENYNTIGNQQQPPDAQTFTLRFYETCDVGVPLPHYLRDCRVRVVNNHGLCKTSSDVAGGWSHYQEVVDGIVLSENRGKRSSYDGADDSLVDELTLELLNIYDAGTMYFSPVPLAGAAITGSVCAVPTANDVAFDCSNGCGDSRCGCKTTCNDGTNTFYIPMGCTGSTTQNYLYYTRDGGEHGVVMTLPVPADGDASPHPKATVLNGRLYVLSYQAPPTLYSIALDAHGVPSGGWTEIATLGGDTATGIPGALVAENGVLHILVQDTANGSRFYSLGDGFRPSDGERFTFDEDATVRSLTVCGDDLYAVGDAAYIQHSADGGASWSTVAPPAVAGVAITVNLHKVVVVGINVWITGENGHVWRSSDEGVSWERVFVGSTSTTITDLTFNGDNVGWLIHGVASIAPYGTVLGGENDEDWLNTSPRIAAWPTGVIPAKAFVPPCATGPKAVNTVAIAANNGTIDQIYIGRGRISGG